MIIAIDAGHYNDTPGKRCLKSIDPKETRERFLNARMAEHVEKLLANYDCKVMRCDDRTGKTDPALTERAERANRAGANVLVSIHHNAGIYGGRGGGIVVFAAKNASTTDDVWIPSDQEVGSTVRESEGIYYRVVFNGAETRKKMNVNGSSAATYWLRSANSTTSFRVVFSDGSFGEIGASSTFGFALGFCT